MILSEIDWLAKASLIALKTAVESRHIAACFLLNRMKFPPKETLFFVLLL